MATTLKFSRPETLIPGRYPAKLTSITDGEGKFGPYLEWTFIVHNADGDAVEVSRRTSQKTGSGSIARVLVESLLNRSVQLDEEIDLDALTGKGVELEIETNANGYDSVANAFPAKADDIAF